MRTLDRKLFRDVRRMWAQALAIALVIACGVATLVLSVGTYRSLEETRGAYYERYRFGDVFASAVRAPKAVADEIAAIDGVATVDARIVRAAILDIEGMREPATGIVISLPPNNDPAVNALFLKGGRLPEPDRANEVAVNANFAKAHGFAIGDTFQAVLNGKRTQLSIVGIVLSPEYVYAIGPGDMMPDDRRFGVLWMPEATVAARFDLSGAFNSVSLALLPSANLTAVLEKVDELLKPYGGFGAHGRKNQLSNAFLDSELSQLKGMAAVIPPIFLLVSAFLINMTLSRTVALEREQIGLLKALGYSRTAIAFHYGKFVLLITAIGVITGGVAGTWLGRGMTTMYARFYAFPFLIFQSDSTVYIIAAGISAAAALAGAIQAIRVAFSLPAAVAMQPAAPVAYRRVFGTGRVRAPFLSQLETMAVRHVTRYPVRSALTAFGISFATALMSMGLGTNDSVNYMIDVIFQQTNRQDASIWFSSERPAAAISEVRALPGVLVAEPVLYLSANISFGQYQRQLSITGQAPTTDLARVLDRDLSPVRLPESGLAIGDRVADILHVRAGDTVHVEFLDGKRLSVDVPVTQIIHSLIGLMVYMDIDALARLSGTGQRISGASIAVDGNHLDDLYRAIKETPAIGAVGLERLTLQRFRDTMQHNILIQLIVYVTLSAIIGFGIVYNSARIQLSERARELAILRVLGFGRAEVSNVLLFETAILVLVAQPVGWLIGYGIGVLATNGLASDIFRAPLVIHASTFAIATLVVGAATAASALIVRRRVDRLDLVRVLKTRE